MRRPYLAYQGDKFDDKKSLFHVEGLRIVLLQIHLDRASDDLLQMEWRSP